MTKPATRKKAPPAVPLTVPTLDQRLDAILEELEAVIDARTDEMCADAPGVPRLVIRRLLEAKGGGCACKAFKALK
jgi:hypothetical protein